MLVVATVAPTIRSFLLPYATYFRDMGWRVEAAANGVSADRAVSTTYDAVHELPLSRSILDTRGMAAAYRSMRALLERDYDLVHVHTPIASLVARAAVRRMPSERRPRVVYTAHGFHFHARGHLLANATFITAERVAGRWTDRLVVINDEDHEAALRYHLVPRSRLVLMPGIGIDTERFAPDAVPADERVSFRADLGVGPETPLFVVVAEFSKRKRPLDVIEATVLMARRDAHVVFLGDGPERGAVEQAIDEHRLADRVHLFGNVPDVRVAVASATALILASSREGLPRSIMEALALEVPAIVSDARGNGDLVLPDAGVVFQVGDVAALARAMDDMVARPDQARAMGRAGRARMVGRYGIQTLLRMHEELYEDVLGQSPSA